MENTPFQTGPATQKQADKTIAVRHSAFGVIESLRQGDVDRTCGLYAVLNGFRLALASHHGLGSRAAWTAYGHAIDHLNSKGLLLEALIRGISFATLLQIAKRLAKLLSDDRVTLTVELPPKRQGQTSEDLFAWIEESLSQDCPVIVRLRGQTDHISVIGEMDEALLHFFDSGDLRTLVRRDVGTKGRYKPIRTGDLCRIRATPCSEPQEVADA